MALQSIQQVFSPAVSEQVKRFALHVRHPVIWLRCAWLHWRIDAINDEIRAYGSDNGLHCTQAVNWLTRRDVMQRRIRELRARR